MKLYDSGEKNLSLDVFSRDRISAELHCLYGELNTKTPYRFGIKAENLCMNSVNGVVHITFIVYEPFSTIRSKGVIQEKILSSHINVFDSRYIQLGLNDQHRYQSLRPFIAYKKLQIPLGKIRISKFKDVK